MQRGEGAQGRSGAGSKAGGVEHVLGHGGRPDDVVVRHRWPVSEVGKEIPAEQRARRLLVEHTGLPSMGHMGSIDVPDSLVPEVEYLAVGKGTGRAVSEVVEGDHAAEGTVGPLGGGGRSQE